MPKLPIISARKLIKVISKQGFTLDHITGSHHIFINSSTRQTISIPVHQGKDLGKGLLRAILKQAKISEADFIKLLK